MKCLLCNHKSTSKGVAPAAFLLSLCHSSKDNEGTQVKEPIQVKNEHFCWTDPMYELYWKKIMYSLLESISPSVSLHRPTNPSMAQLGNWKRLLTPTPTHKRSKLQFEFRMTLKKFYLLHASTSGLWKAIKPFTRFLASQRIYPVDVNRGVTLFPWQRPINIERYIFLKKIHIAWLQQQVPDVAAFPGALPSYFPITNQSN